MLPNPRLDTRPFDRLPVQVGGRLRPHVDRIADDALTEVLKAAAGTRAANLRSGEVRDLVVDVLRRFCDLIEEPVDGWRRAATAYVRLGGLICRQGGRPEEVQKLLNRTARSTVERIGVLAPDLGLDWATLPLLTEAQLSYVDGLSSAVRQGFAEQSDDLQDGAERRRLHLMALLLSDPVTAGPVTTGAEVTAVAGEIGWPLPRTVAVAVLRRRDPDAAPVIPYLRDVLADLGGGEPCLVVPDPDGPGRRRLLEVLLPDWIVAVGPTMPLAQAAESLVWARDALALAVRGVLPAGGLVRCADHVPTLAIFRAEDLIDQVAAVRLAPLLTLPSVQAHRLGETLLALLQCNFNATEVGGRLHVHPQTVRQRLRLLEDLFGDDLKDPRRCLEIEMILHARLAGARSRDVAGFLPSLP